MQQHWQQCRLSHAKVAPDVVADTLVFWRDGMSMYSLLQFKDLADLGAPQVGFLCCIPSPCPLGVGTYAMTACRILWVCTYLLICCSLLYTYKPVAAAHALLHKPTVCCRPVSFYMQAKQDGDVFPFRQPIALHIHMSQHALL